MQRTKSGVIVLGAGLVAMAVALLVIVMALGAGGTTPKASADAPLIPNGTCTVKAPVDMKGNTWQTWNCRPDINEFPYNQVNIQVGKPNKDLKVWKMEAVCKSTGEQQKGTLTKHTNFANPTPTPLATATPWPLVDHEQWTVKFKYNCLKEVNIYLVPVNAANILVIKEIAFVKNLDLEDGNLSGVSDILVWAGAKDQVGLFTCINRTDHDADKNTVTTAAVCASDSDTSDPNSALGGINPPGEGFDLLPGPPPPPGYSNLPPNKGNGRYIKDGSADILGGFNGFECAEATPCLITITCFPKLGGGPLGPNTVSVVIIEDPKGQMATTGKQEGKVLIYSGVDNKTCYSHTPDPNTPPAELPINIQPADPLDPLCVGGTVGCTLTPWRTANGTTAPDGKPDYDGDGCSDYQELAKPGQYKCGDEPWNPYDSNTTDFSGSYGILVESLEADLDSPGGYFHCLADIQQDVKDLTARVYCYTDSVNIPVNPEVGPETGDGFPGVAPPFPYGDVDDKHTELTGVVDNGDNTLKLKGCFEDRDQQSPLGNVYVEMTVDQHTGMGTVDIWTGQDSAMCTASHVWGEYGVDSGKGEPVVVPGVLDFDDAPIMIARQEPGPKANGERDTDQDGCSNKDELQDYDPGLEPVPGKRGELRDPYNRWDYYDAGGPGNGPPDGVIDLANDILGVILRYTANPTLPYDANYDRPAVTAGSANHWNRGAPDGPIDLPNDILGVILQYQHCPDVPSN